MTVAERQKAEAQLYRQMVPEIVEAILRADEPVAASERLAHTYDLDNTLVYRWFQLTETDLERFRKRRAALVLVPLWLTLLGAAGIVAAAFLGGVSRHASWVPWALSGLTGAFLITAVRLRGLKRRAYFRRLSALVAGED